ncbi:MAG: hypothetical protein [Bacteriophage sp.]|nr:MAG: hypothetical protein [Bacteriophage sp.]
MKKYRLHNITDFGTEIHDFDTEKGLNNYIAIFVDTPYWVENLETNEITYPAGDDNVSRETPQESASDIWLREKATEEDERFSLSDKILCAFLIILTMLMAVGLFYLLLSIISFIVEYLSSFDWKLLYIL